MQALLTKVNKIAAQAARSTARAKLLRWAFWLVSTVIGVAASYWVYGSYIEAYQLNEATDTSVGVHLVLPAETQARTGARPDDIHTVLANRAAFLRFTGELPQGTAMKVDIWAENGERFVLHQFLVTQYAIDHGSIFIVPIVGLDAQTTAIQPTSWRLGATRILMGRDNMQRVLGDVVLTRNEVSHADGI